MSDFAERQEQRAEVAQQAEQRLYADQLRRIKDLVPRVVAYLEGNAETDPRYQHNATAWVAYADPSDDSLKKQFCWVISRDEGDSYSVIGITTSGVIVEFSHIGSDYARPASARADFFNKITQHPWMIGQMLHILEYVLQPPRPTRRSR